jgi:hypothetical protein
MVHFWTVTCHSKNAIINTNTLKYKEVFLHFNIGRKQIETYGQGKTEKFIPFLSLKSPLLNMTGAFSFSPS